MKFLWGKKDGGPESRVWMYGFEWKRFFSVLVLRFENGSREAYHSHAFNAISWVLWGWLIERFLRSPNRVVDHTPSLTPIRTGRDDFHKVSSFGTTWVLSFRGPWARYWEEYVPETDRRIMLGQGRAVLFSKPANGEYGEVHV